MIAFHTETSLVMNPATNKIASFGRRKLQSIVYIYYIKNNVWCGFWTRGVIGPLFDEYLNERVVTVIGEHYTPMIQGLNLMKQMEL